MAPERSAPLRAAIVGCGGISHEHLAHLSGSPTAEVVAVCDRSAATAHFVAELYGVPSWHTDAATMLAEVAPEVVHVLTPPPSHVELAAMALEADAHVICEKPLAPTAAEAADLFRAAAARGRHLVETRNLLYNGPVQRIDDLLARGALGAVREVDIHLCLDLADGPFGDLNLEGPGVGLPGGAVHDFLPHLSYLFLHYAGEQTPVEEVVGHLSNRGGNPRVGFDHLDALVGAAEVRGHLRITPDVAPDALRLRVAGTDGSVETDLFQPYVRFRRATDSGIRGVVEQITSGTRLVAASATNLATKVFERGSYQGVGPMLEDLYRALRDGQRPPIDPAAVLAGARLTDRVVALGGPVRLEVPTS